MHALKPLLALLAVLAVPAWAAVPQATVDAVQMPAWLEHNGRTQPLAVGMAVVNGDRIRTEEGARVYLKLAEGSTVKLGESARLAFFSHSLKPQTVFKGALDVLAGAFRFTTDALKQVKSREVSIRVGTATAGIRGTDVWGKTDAKRDLVMLIDGRIEVSHTSGKIVEMSRPLTAFVAPKDGGGLAIETVAPEDFTARARETEIEAGDGAARAGGKWKLLLGRHGAKAAALEQYDAARGAGYPARITPRSAGSGAWNYEVVIAGFPDETEALKVADRLKGTTGITATAVR